MFCFAGCVCRRAVVVRVEFAPFTEHGVKGVGLQTATLNQIPKNFSSHPVFVFLPRVGFSCWHPGP